MNNLEYWKREIADIPEQDSNGDWFDLETGIYYDPSHHFSTGGKITRWEPSSDVKDYRKVAKFYGGKALTGSKKQKEWGEKLRHKVLTSKSLSDEQKAEFIALGGITQTAKFWISNRDLDPREFIAEKFIAEREETIAFIKENENALWSPKNREARAAEIAIYKRLINNKFRAYYEFTGDERLYNDYHELRKMEERSGVLIEVEV